MNLFNMFFAKTFYRIVALCISSLAVIIGFQNCSKYEAELTLAEDLNSNQNNQSNQNNEKLRISLGDGLKNTNGVFQILELSNNKIPRGLSRDRYFAEFQVSNGGQPFSAQVESYNQGSGGVNSQKSTCFTSPGPDHILQESVPFDFELSNIQRITRLIVFNTSNCSGTTNSGNVIAVVLKSFTPACEDGLIVINGICSGTSIQYVRNFQINSITTDPVQLGERLSRISGNVNKAELRENSTSGNLVQNYSVRAVAVPETLTPVLLYGSCQNSVVGSGVLPFSFNLLNALIGNYSVFLEYYTGPGCLNRIVQDAGSEYSVDIKCADGLVANSSGVCQANAAVSTRSVFTATNPFSHTVGSGSNQGHVTSIINRASLYRDLIPFPFSIQMVATTTNGSYATGCINSQDSNIINVGYQLTLPLGAYRITPVFYTGLGCATSMTGLPPQVEQTVVVSCAPGLTADINRICRPNSASQLSISANVSECQVDASGTCTVAPAVTASASPNIQYKVYAKLPNLSEVVISGSQCISGSHRYLISWIQRGNYKFTIRDCATTNTIPEKFDTVVGR